MATRPFEEYDLHNLPLPSPPPETADSTQCRPSSINSGGVQLPFTPPRSRPTTSPSSPEYQTRILPAEAGEQRGHTRRLVPMSRIDTAKVAELCGGSLDSESMDVTKASSTVDHVEVSTLPEGYGDSAATPILPRTRVSFPAVSSDESADEAPRRTRTETRPGKTPRRRVVSQEIIVTTSTTRKLERRKFRYSASILDEMQDDHLDSTRREKSSCGNYHADRLLSPHRTASPSRTVVSPASSRSSRLGRASPSSPLRSQSQNRVKEQTSPLAPRPLRALLTPYHRRKSSSGTAPHCSSTPNTLAHRPERDPPQSSKSIHDGDDGFDRARRLDLAPTWSELTTTTTTTTTIPLLRPVVNLFTFVLVSSFCCVTVSAVLVASFGCTVYDDCAKRWTGLNQSLREAGGTPKSVKGGILGGERIRVERVLGTANGATENAHKATEWTDEDRGIDRRSWVGSLKRGAIPTGTAAASGTYIDEGASSGGVDDKGNRRKKRSSSRCRRASSKLDDTGPSRSSLRRESSNPLAAASSSHLSPAESASSTPAGYRSGWATDEDALPYDVPHSTPRTSRPASPHRLPRSRTSTADSTPSSSTTSSTLPPRPHLAVLLPSLLVAVVLTLVKLAYSFYDASSGEREANRQRRREWCRRDGPDDARRRCRTSSSPSLSLFDCYQTINDDRRADLATNHE